MSMQPFLYRNFGGFNIILSLCLGFFNRRMFITNSTLRVKRIYLIAFFLFSGIPVSFAQAPTEISGVINEYSAVTGVSYPRTVTADNVTIFAEGDTVLLIQMKGSTALVHEEDDTNYGIRQNLSNAGAYEFLIIESISGNDILFTRNFVNDDPNSLYHSDDLLQLVKVKSYRNAVVRGGSLVPKAWDGTTGGVLALIVKNVLSLENSIDASGTGFRGAEPVEMAADTTCITDPEIYSYDESFLKAGRKGEGLALYFWDDINSLRVPLEDDFAKGKGRLLNAGGGGNSRLAGGGGGGGFKRGGFGGRPSCSSASEFRGFPGNGLNTYYNDFPWGHRLFMPGGGGSGTSFETINSEKGGNAGGILIILAKEIVSNGFYIRSDGANADNAEGGGAGGGGGGGPIVLIIDQFDFLISISAQGGSGGSTTAPLSPYSGPGGGGGGGVLFYRQPSKPAQIDAILTKGNAGVTGPGGSSSNLSTSGEDGDSIGNFAIRLNGFLFNNLEDYFQTVCQDVRPEEIVGTIPKGGTPPYTFEWQISLNNIDWTTIDDSTRIHFHPPAFDTPGIKYIRRIVRDDDSDIPIEDFGLPIEITVLPKIDNNLITAPASICQGVIPTLEAAAASGGDGVNYFYQWEERTLTGDWDVSPESSQDQNYTAPQLFNTTLYRRIVVSSVCVDTSSYVEQAVHPVITNNSISGAQPTCSNKLPSSLSGELPEGGIGSYTYLWQFRTSGDWDPADGTNSGLNYTFPNAIPETREYRRVSYSGACENSSIPMTLTIYPEIQGNTISSDQTICSNTQPAEIGGGTLSAGDGSFRFSWQISTDGSNWNPLAATLQNFTPGDLLEPAYFRREAKSGPADECESLSNEVFINFRPLTAHIIPSIDTICDQSSTLIEIEFTGEGPFSVTLLRSGTTAESGTVTTNPGTVSVMPRSADSITYTYTIETVSDAIGCIIRQDSISGSASVRVYGVPQTNAGPDQEICGLTVVLNAVPHIGKGMWTHSNPPWGTISDSSLPNPVVTASSYGIHSFTWEETIWQCVNSDQVNVTFWEEPDDPDAGPDQSLNYIFSSFMNASSASAGSGTWTALSGPVNIVFPTDPLTQVNNLTYGLNQFEWAVRNGICPVKTDTIDIVVEEVFRPTGFSPNNDGMNDFLMFPGLENAETNQLVIVNRQGNEIFRAVNYENNWDGTRSGAPMPDDTYYYLLTVDNKHTYRGFIVLKR